MSEDTDNAPMPLVIASAAVKEGESWKKRHPGKTSLVVLTLGKKEWFKEWEDEKCMKRDPEYKALKERLAIRMFEGLFRFYPQLKDKIDYYERKPMIEKAFSITSGINKTGTILTIILSIVALLIAFNVIKIAIYNSEKEISVMRLVGASNWFIRGPFLIQGAIIGFIAAFIVLLLTFIFCYSVNSSIKILTPDIGVFKLFANNFWTLFLLQFLTGIGLGVISSFFAVKKYLKV